MATEGARTYTLSIAQLRALLVRHFGADESAQLILDIEVQAALVTKAGESTLLPACAFVVKSVTLIAPDGTLVPDVFRRSFLPN